MSTNDAPGGVNKTAAIPLLQHGAGQFGAPLTEHRLDAFRLYRDKLLAWNATRASLTAITNHAEVESRLFLESLWCAAAFPPTDGSRLIDVGSGGLLIDRREGVQRGGISLTLVESHSLSASATENLPDKRRQVSTTHTVRMARV